MLILGKIILYELYCIYDVLLLLYMSGRYNKDYSIIVLRWNNFF